MPTQDSRKDMPNKTLPKTTPPETSPRDTFQTSTKSSPKTPLKTQTLRKRHPRSHPKDITPDNQKDIIQLSPAPQKTPSPIPCLKTSPKTAAKESPHRIPKGIPKGNAQHVTQSRLRDRANQNYTQANSCTHSKQDTSKHKSQLHVDVNMASSKTLRLRSKTKRKVSKATIFAHLLSLPNLQRLQTLAGACSTPTHLANTC